MGIARELDGVISGEHGIGITKLEFLTDDETRDFRAYKQRVDPHGHFNLGKLQALPAIRADLRERVHAELRADGRRVADHAAVGHRRDHRFDQGLPALRQVQAGLRDARAAREPALFARATRSSRRRC